jgi:hypothetical protein
VSEFVPNDIYSTIILWGSSNLLDSFKHKPMAKAIMLNLDTDEDSEEVCKRTNKDMVDKIIVKSAFHRSLYQCYPWSKFEIIPTGLPAETVFQTRFQLPKPNSHYVLSRLDKMLSKYI